MRNRRTRRLAALACAAFAVSAALVGTATAEFAVAPPAAPYSDVVTSTRQISVNVACAHHLITFASLAGPASTAGLDDCRAIKGDTLPAYADYVTGLTRYGNAGKTCAEHTIYHSGYFTQTVEDCRESAAFATCKATQFKHGNELVNGFACPAAPPPPVPPSHHDDGDDHVGVEAESIAAPLFQLVAVRQNKRGNAAITMKCPAYATRGCIGQAGLDAVLPLARSKHRTRNVTLGKVVFPAAQDRLATVVVTLSKKVRTLLRTRGKLSVRVFMTGWDPRGPAAWTSAPATLKHMRH